MSSTIVQAVGECMIEVTRGADGARISYSGDTFNTAVYLARSARQRDASVDVRYLSGVGDDAESGRMRSFWSQQGVSDDAVVLRGRAPGLYMISTDDRGERSFAYWRKDSAAAAMFVGADWVERIHGDYVYLSGITLQLIPAPVRDLLVARLTDLRRSGARVVFDSNYRPQAWPSKDAARRAMEEILAVTDMALVTWEDEARLTDCPDVAACAARLAGLGVNEIVVKVGAAGAWVAGGGQLTLVPTAPVEPIDTTAAGDSFNGAYLAARINGDAPLIAAAAGNALAAAVVRHRGAII